MRVWRIFFKHAAKPLSMRLCSTPCGKLVDEQVMHIGTTFLGYNPNAGAGYSVPEVERPSEPVRVMTVCGLPFLLQIAVERPSEPVRVMTLLLPRFPAWPQHGRKTIRTGSGYDMGDAEVRRS